MESSTAVTTDDDGYKRVDYAGLVSFYLRLNSCRFKQSFNF